HAEPRRIPPHLLDNSLAQRFRNAQPHGSLAMLRQRRPWSNRRGLVTARGALAPPPFGTRPESPHARRRARPLPQARAHATPIPRDRSDRAQTPPPARPPVDTDRHRAASGRFVGT